jgi:DNA-nicking Smr family endonuclease
MSLRRRPRRLTAEEVRLWHGIARTARRLGGARPDPEADPGAEPVPEPAAAEKIVPPAMPARPAAPARPMTTRAPMRVPIGNGGGIQVDPAPDPVAALAAAPPLERRRHARLVRGKLEPEARLDLHGMTREAAHAALIAFVNRAQARGLRLVLVITGKGRADGSDAIVPERQGVLRHSLPHWLATPPLTGRVAEVRPAHPRHGGAGAIYLTLRRRR